MHSVIEQYCSKEWRDFVNFHSQIIKISTDELVFNFGDDVEGLFFILSGKVKITKKIPSGKIRIIRLAADGDIIGHRGFGGHWKYSVSATALEDTELLFVPKTIFDQTVKANPDFGFYMMMFFAEELRATERLAYQCPVKNLVASTLLTNCNVFGLEKGSNRLSYTLSRKDIASMAGTTYESVVRSLAELQKEGTIKIDGKSTHIINKEKLERIAGEIPQN